MRLIVPIFLLLLLSESVRSQDTTYVPPPEFDELFTVKETFKYEVKYGPFKLGWVDVEILGDTLYNGKMHQILRTEMRSNAKSPFISREIDVFYSFFFENEDGVPATTKYWKDDIDAEDYSEIIYEFDREEGLVYYKEADDTQDTLDIVEPATAGHIIFYFARIFAGSGEDSRLPVYISKDVGYINFENPTKLELRNYRPFDEPVYAYTTYGETEDMTGPFGFKGKFRAWFLNDELRVPLEARVRVIFGNAIIKLIEYERETL